MNRFFYITAALGTFFFSFSASAEDINIHADKQVEWHSKDQKMVAIGNAVANKKDLEIRAQELTAFYEKTKAGKQQISKISARDDVKMKSGETKAFGDKMDYDLAADKALLLGKPAKIQTVTDTITAEDGITYYPSEQKAVAEGNVYATNGESKIYSDKLVSFFEKDTAGKTVMKKVEVYGHVKIVTKDGTVLADKGIYQPKIGIVKLYDNVMIDQKGNKLHGDFAETNLNTGISKMLAGKGGKKRVTGTFKEKAKDAAAPTKGKNNVQ